MFGSIKVPYELQFCGKPPKWYAWYAWYMVCMVHGMHGTWYAWYMVCMVYMMLVCILQLRALLVTYHKIQLPTVFTLCLMGSVNSCGLDNVL